MNPVEPNDTNTRLMLLHYPVLVRLIQQLERVDGVCPCCKLADGHETDCQWRYVWTLITILAT